MITCHLKRDFRWRQLVDRHRFEVLLAHHLPAQHLCHLILVITDIFISFVLAVASSPVELPREIIHVIDEKRLPANRKCVHFYYIVNHKQKKSKQSLEQ